jgi:hypothetical protein
MVRQEIVGKMSGEKKSKDKGADYSHLSIAEQKERARRELLEAAKGLGKPSWPDETVNVFFR